MDVVAIVTIKSEQTKDAQLGRIQTYQAATTVALNRLPFAQGGAIEDVVFTAGQTRAIEHKLGRTPLRFIVTDAQTNPPLIKRVSSDTNNITLTSTNAGTYSFWVY